MAEHFKLEITNRSTKITTWTGVSSNFADEFRENLIVSDTTSNSDKHMTDAMRTVFSITNEDATSTIKNDSSKSDGKYSTYNYVKRVKQRRSKFKTLAYINFTVPNVQFVTLTFDGKLFDGADDLDISHKAFQKFIKRVRHKYDDFRYLAVFSRQKNKHWHYHMICNFDESVSGKIIREIWSYGIIHNTVLTRYDEFETKLSYCIDNMNQVAWDDLQGEKGYLSSKGLQDKIVLRSWNENEHDEAFKYLSEILGSSDKPVPVANVELHALLTDYEINHKNSSSSSSNLLYLLE